MSNLRKHILERHQPALTQRDLDSLGAHGNPGTMRDMHNWVHEEFAGNRAELNHYHDAYGQVHDERT